MARIVNSFVPALGTLFQSLVVTLLVLFNEPFQAYVTPTSYPSGSIEATSRAGDTPLPSEGMNTQKSRLKAGSQ